MGEPKEQVGKKTFYSEVLICGNKVIVVLSMPTQTLREHHTDLRVYKCPLLVM